MKYKSREARKWRQEESEFIVTGLSWFESHSCKRFLSYPETSRPTTAPIQPQFHHTPPTPNPQRQNWVL